MEGFYEKLKITLKSLKCDWNWYNFDKLQISMLSERQLFLCYDNQWTNCLRISYSSISFLHIMQIFRRLFFFFLESHTQSFGAITLTIIDNLYKTEYPLAQTRI